MRSGGGTVFHVEHMDKDTGFCINCGAKLSFCGTPFSAELLCRKCGRINVFEESQQPKYLKEIQADQGGSR